MGASRVAVGIVLTIASGAAAIAACGLDVVGDGRSDALPDGAPRPSADGAAGTDGGGTGADAGDAGVTADGATCSQTVCNGVCCAGLCAANACKSLELWLRADEGVTTGSTFVWADQSGKGRDVSQAAPPMRPTIVAGVLAGRQVVRFADGQRLEGPDVQGFQLGTGPLAWFHVSRSSGNSNDRNQVFGTIRNGAPFDGMTAGFGPNDRPYGLLRQGDGNEVFLRAGDGGQQWVIMDLRRNGGVTELRRNGVVLSTASSNQNVSGGNIIVGSERLGGTEFLTGDIAEILIFAGVFSDAERASVTKYLSDRHQIPVP